MPGRAYRSIKKQLGAQDAVFELQELAVQELCFQIEQSGNAQQYLADVCARHHIKVDVVESNTMERMTGRLRILLAVGAFERFLHELRDEMIQLGNAPFFQDGCKLDAILQRCGERHGEAGLRAVLREMILYFVAIRNEAAHPFDVQQFAGEVARRSEDLNHCDRRAGLAEWIRTPQFPKSSNHMGFEHYILCSRVLKTYAFELWRLEIESLRPLPEELRWRQRFANLVHNAERFQTACISDIRTRLCVDESEAALLYESV